MSKRYLLILLLILTTTLIQAQLPISQIFMTIPDSIFPYLDTRGRMLMLEYYNQQVQDSVDNIYGGKSCVLDKTDNYLKAHIADGFTIELLSKNNSFYFIQTLCVPICSSVVKQYYANWIYLNEIQSDKQSDFMMATIVNDSILWIDQTPLLLDDEEKKYYLQQ